MEVRQQKLREARPAFERLEKSSLRACLWVHWLRERIKAEAATMGSGAIAAMHRVLSAFMKGYYDDELDSVAEAGTRSTLPLAPTKLSTGHVAITEPTSRGWIVSPPCPVD